MNMTNALQEGRDAYAETELTDNPYAEGTAEHADWKAGWKEMEKNDPLAYMNVGDEDEADESEDD